jgi:hypothetical protein
MYFRKSHRCLFRAIFWSAVLQKTDHKASNGKVNSAFLASLLNTAALGLLYHAWIVSPFYTYLSPLFIPCAEV